MEIEQMKYFSKQSMPQSSLKNYIEFIYTLCSSRHGPFRTSLKRLLEKLSKNYTKIFHREADSILRIKVIMYLNN